MSEPSPDRSVPNEDPINSDISDTTLTENFSLSKLGLRAKHADLASAQILSTTDEPEGSPGSNTKSYSPCLLAMSTTSPSTSEPG